MLPLRPVPAERGPEAVAQIPEALHGLVREHRAEMAGAARTPAGHGRRGDAAVPEEQVGRGFRGEPHGARVHEQGPAAVWPDAGIVGEPAKDEIAALLPRAGRGSDVGVRVRGGQGGGDRLLGYADLADDVRQPHQVDVGHDARGADDPAHPPADHAQFLAGGAHGVGAPSFVGPGEHAAWAADVPHLYGAPEGDVDALLIVRYPHPGPARGGEKLLFERAANTTVESDHVRDIPG
ncbi:hypothetical protein STBA_48400 [Streptomyces sp. MP131-18]|nr:hypothetical protein STBA_48400 [Streptomyces sp. MP131-18]